MSAVRTCCGQHNATYLEEDERDDGAGVGLLADGPEPPCWCPREYPYDRRRCRVVSQRRQRTDEVVHEAGQAEGQEREVGREEAEAVGNRRKVQVVDGAVLDESPFELSLSQRVSNSAHLEPLVQLRGHSDDVAGSWLWCLKQILA